MIEIENKKKEKHNELIKKQTQRKQRKCRVCVSIFAGGIPDFENDDDDNVTP